MFRFIHRVSGELNIKPLPALNMQTHPVKTPLLALVHVFYARTCVVCRDVSVMPFTRWWCDIYRTEE